MQKLNTIGFISLTLVIVGALNWGLLGFFSFNLVSSLFGEGMITKVIYDLVGLSAIYVAFSCFCCSKSEK